MASSNISLETVKSALLEKGFYAWEDGATGERVAEMETRGFPYWTEYGLDFCAETAFDLVSPLLDHSFGSRTETSQRIQSVLEELFDRCTLAHWLRYEEHPNHVECFRRGGPKAGRRLMVVHICSKGSSVDYYAGSHLHDLETSKGLRSLHEIPFPELQRVGCVPDTREFKDGGL
jgi:hypothetical protein